MRTILLTVTGLILAINLSSAQVPYEWMRFYDEGGSEVGYDVYPASNGDIIASGHSNWFVWVARLDVEGDIIWHNTYLDGGNDRGYSVIELDNGDLAIGGIDGVDHANPYSGQEFMGMRLNSDGEEIWSGTYGDGSCKAVIELKNGNLAFAGRASEINAARLIITDGDGEEIVNQTYRHGQRPSFEAMREADGGIVLISSNLVGGGNPWMMKVDYEGEVQWIRDFVFNNVSGVLLYPNSLISTSDGGFAFCLTLNVGGGGGYRPAMIKTNSQGQEEWRSVFEIDNHSYSLVSVPEVGYLVVGGRTICTNERGEELWDKHFSPPDNEDHELPNWYSVIRLADGTFVEIGRGWLDNMPSTAIIKFPLISWQPTIFFWSPEDTLITVIAGDSVEFIVQARDSFGRDLEQEFWVADTFHAVGDSVWVRFDSLGVTNVEGRVFADENISTITWHVTVTDLYISAFTPDTLNLTLPRSSSVDFSIDTVRYTDGDPPEYLWTVTNLDNNEQSQPGVEAGATITFNQSGNYTVVGLAYRGESSDAVTWNITVRGAIWAFAPEDLTFEVLPDSLIQFDVLPTVPDAEVQIIRWLVDGEVVAEDTTLLQWSFGSVDNFPRYLAQVQVVVADTVEADTVSWEVTVREPDAVDDKRDAYPTRMELLSVSPNPFNSTLTIRFDVGARHAVPLQIAIHDISGRMVAEIASPTDVFARNEETKQSVGGFAKTSSVVWDASAIPAGVYFVRLQSGQEIATKKVVLMK